MEYPLPNKINSKRSSIQLVQTVIETNKFLNNIGEEVEDLKPKRPKNDIRDIRSFK